MKVDMLQLGLIRNGENYLTVCIRKARIGLSWDYKFNYSTEQRCKFFTFMNEKINIIIFDKEHHVSSWEVTHYEISFLLKLEPLTIGLNCD